MTSRIHRRSVLLVSLAITSATLLLSGPVLAAPARTYRVTIENLTPARGPGASQVLSPALVVVHDRTFDLFTVGERASQSVIDVAEDAITTTGTSLLGQEAGVEAVTAEGTPTPPGGRFSFEITATGDARFLSLVTMLVNTNDAFTGLDAVRLTGGTKTYRVFAYDAGSEVNDQLRANIPGPCCGDGSRGGTTENLTIRHHEGILANTGDLTPEMWGWPMNQPVALVTVERIRE